nr:Fe-S cluster assembly protein SufD [Devriesea agamarum]
MNAAPEASRASRLRSATVADHAIPTGREEEWRFAPLKDLAPLFEDVADDPDALRYTVSGHDEAVLPVRTLAPGQSPRGSALLPEDRVAAIAMNRTQDALYLCAPRNTEVHEPVRVNLVGEGAGRIAHGHVVLETHEGAQATFVLNHTGSAVYAQNLEMIVGDNSSMTVISVQEWDDDAVHVSAHVARIGRDARLKHIVVTLGGRAVRVNSEVDFTAPGGEAEQIGLYFSDEGQHLEHRLFVDHAAPQCTSNVTYKGALQGQGARSVWVGDVLIRNAAEGTNTYELNRNLVLTEGARADSVPNLEIETGEIEGAGHASATGRFDDEQLFYLRARGIPEIEARRLVVRGFFADLIQQIEIAEVREHLTDAIERELARSMN